MLSPVRGARRPERICLKVERTALPEGTSGLSSQQWLLKHELKLANRTNRVGEGGLQMRDGLEKWIRVGTIRRTLSAAKTDAQNIQASAQPLEQVINRLQGRWRLDREKDRPDGSTGQKPGQQLPQDGGGDRMAGQHIVQENGEGVPAATTLAAVGAIDTLASFLAPIVSRWVLAKKQTVPV